MHGLNSRQLIAKRIAKEFTEECFINLGGGIPNMITNYMHPDVRIVIHSENGIVGLGPKDPSIPDEYYDRYLLDSGNHPITCTKGAAIVDSCTSFGLIRGGHLAATVLGAMQIDTDGNIANWKAPGGKLAGMGGAMDLVCGAKKVIAALIHCDKKGNSKLMKQCTFPLTGMNCVDMVVTELCVMDVDKENHRFILREYAPGVTVEEILEKTPGCDILVDPDIKEMDLSDW